MKNDILEIEHVVLRILLNSGDIGATQRWMCGGFAEWHLPPGVSESAQ